MSRKAAESSTSDLSSPLSDICSEQELETPDATPHLQNLRDRGFDEDAEHDEEEEVRGGASLLKSAAPTPAGKVLDKEDGKKQFPCPHCDKSYDTEKSYKVSQLLICGSTLLLTRCQRHVNDKKTICFRNRNNPVAVAGEGSKWACDRCKTQFPQRWNVEVCLSIIQAFNLRNLPTSSATSKGHAGKYATDAPRTTARTATRTWSRERVRPA